MEQVSAGEPGNEGVGGRCDELVRSAQLEDVALGENADPVGERSGILEVMGDEDRRQAELAQQLLELGAHTRARVRVERGHRLVEQQHRGIACERPGQRDPLALAARELLGPRPRQVRDPEPLEQLVHAVAAAEADVRLDGEVREERVLLEDQPDPPLFRGQIHATLGVEQHLVPEHDPPPARPDEAGDRAQRGRLARPRRPDQRESLAPDLER